MPIHYDRGDDHIVRITIDRPEARNAMDMEHFAQLRVAWERFGDDDEAWVAVITGVGADFCVGRRPQDLHPRDHPAPVTDGRGRSPRSTATASTTG